MTDDRREQRAADERAAFGLVKESQRQHDQLKEDYRITLTPFGDVESPQTPFNYAAFIAWYHQLLQHYELNMTHPGTDLEYNICKDIVYYLNRSMAFVKETVSYWILTHDFAEGYNRWKEYRKVDFLQHLGSEKVNVPSIEIKVSAKGKQTTIRKSKPMYLVNIWLESPFQRKLEKIVFKPASPPIVNQQLNVWIGLRWTMQDIYYSVKQNPLELQGIVLEFLRHLFIVICGSSRVIFTYWLDWWATKYRYPWAKLQTTLVAYSVDQRVGKGFAFSALGRAFGQHYTVTTNKEDITGRFTSVQFGKVVIYLDEAFWGGDHIHHSVLKSKVTDPLMRAEEKFKHAFITDNPCSYVQATNNLKALPADQTEMRYCISECRPRDLGNAEYFRDLESRMKANDEAGLKALAFFFLYSYKISEGFGLGHRVPHTTLLDIQKEESADSAIGFLKLCIDRGYHRHPNLLSDVGDPTSFTPNVFPGEKNNGRNPANSNNLWVEWVMFKDFWRAYQDYCVEFGIVPRYKVQKKFLLQRVKEFYGAPELRELKQVVHHYDEVRAEPGTVNALKNGTRYSTQTYINLPGLQHCKVNFARKSGMNYERPPVENNQPQLYNHLDEALNRSNVMIVEDYNSVFLPPIMENWPSPITYPLGRSTRIRKRDESIGNPLLHIYEAHRYPFAPLYGTAKECIENFFKPEDIPQGEEPTTSDVDEEIVEEEPVQKKTKTSHSVETFEINNNNNNNNLDVSPFYEIAEEKEGPLFNVDDFLQKIY